MIIRYISILLLVLFSLGLSSCSSSEHTSPQTKIGSDILKTFGHEDLVRMQRFVDRANEGKIDYLIAIPPIFDGGYVIYDLLSDRGSIKVRMDYTRDNNGDARYELTCKSIKFTQEANEQNVIVEQCKGPTGDIPEHKLFTLDTKR